MASDASLKSQLIVWKWNEINIKEYRDGIKIVILTINARPQKMDEYIEYTKGL